MWQCKLSQRKVNSTKAALSGVVQHTHKQRRSTLLSHRIQVKSSSVSNLSCIWYNSMLYTAIYCYMPLAHISELHVCVCVCVCFHKTWTGSKHHESKFSSRHYWAPGRHRRQTHSHHVAILPMPPCQCLTSVCCCTRMQKPALKIHCKMHLVRNTDAHWHLHLHSLRSITPTQTTHTSPWTKFGWKSVLLVG